VGWPDNRFLSKLLNSRDRLVKAGTNVPATAVLLYALSIFFLFIYAGEEDHSIPDIGYYLHDLRRLEPYIWLRSYTGVSCLSLTDEYQDHQEIYWQEISPKKTNPHFNALHHHFASTGRGIFWPFFYCVGNADELLWRIFRIS